MRYIDGQKNKYSVNNVKKFHVYCENNTTYKHVFCGKNAELYKTQNQWTIKIQNNSERIQRTDF
jgi:hypothetical protein